MKAGVAISGEEKRRALEAVLGSETFARSDKLKQFLRYICEMEFSGQAAGITEHTIGVEALGRPPGYSTGDDSIVRSTAYVLRQKLLELYEKELPDAPVRIELHKGSYVPLFVGAHEGGEVAVLRPAKPVARMSGIRLFAAGFAAAALMGLVLFLFLRGPMGSRPDQIVAEAWGSLARPETRAVMFIGHPPHFLVKPYREGEQPTDELLLPVPKEAYVWYRALQPMEPDQQLYSYATGNSCLLGDAVAAAIGARTLGQWGVSFQIVPERAVRLPALRGTDALLFGNPDYSPAIAALLARGAYSIGFDPARKSDVVTDLVTKRVYTPRPSPKSRVGEAYGLITVQTQADGKSSQHRTIVFSGVNSAGTQAAMEYFSSAAHLRELKQRLAKEGQSGFPAGYQVLVKSTTETSVPISFSYESHHVLARQPGERP